MDFKTLIGSAALCGVCFPLVPAYAADDEPTEIIVTARKREESILNVPVVATVLSQEILADTQTDDLYTIASRVPGLVLGSNISGVGTQAVIRGIGTTAINPTADNSVSLNIDGLQLSQGLAYTVGMFDVGQVEVLKGPQALFYGKNSPGGVISLRSADPTDEFEVIGRVAYEFEAQERTFDAIVSGPVSPSVKLRIAARYSDQDGYFDNVVDPVPEGSSFLGVANPPTRDFPERNWLLRGTLLFEPSYAYSARLKVNYTHRYINGNSVGLQLGYCPEGVNPNPVITTIQFVNPSEDCKLDNEVRIPRFDPAAFPGSLNDGFPFNRLQQYFGTLEQNLQLSDGLALTTVSGIYRADQQDNFNTTTVSGAAAVYGGLGSDFSNEQFTQEVRLVSDFAESPVDFTLGAFYQNASISNRVVTQGNILFGFPRYVQYVQHKLGIESVSAFGQLLWEISPQFELAAGARWTHEVRTHREYTFLNAFLQFMETPALVPLAVPRLSSSNVSPDVSLTYKPTPDLTIFGSYRQGFKSGSFNTVQFVRPNTHAEFNDEKTEGFEAGVKARVFDRQLNVNLAAYHYKITGLQVGSVEIGDDGSFGVRTVNAASVTSKGIDFDFTFSPHAVPNLSVYGGVSYNHARYDSFPNAPCGNGQTIAQGCDQLFNPQAGQFTAQDLSGERLVRAPDWSGNAGFNYELPVGGDVRVKLGGSALYSSSYWTNLINLPGFMQSSYWKLNANVAVSGPDDAWELALVGNNVTDEVTTGFCGNTNVVHGVVFGGQFSGRETNGPAGLDEGVCLADRGREIWLRLTLRPMNLFK